MPLTRKVRDIMIPIADYAVVRSHEPLKEAVLHLRRVYCEVETGACTEAGHRTTLVVDDKGELVGILDFKAILKVLIPEIAGGMSAKLASLGISAAFAEESASDLDETKLSLRARAIKNAETPIREVMLKLRGTIDADTDLGEALKTMFRNKLVVLPVFDAGKLVGVVRDSDIFLAVASIFGE